MRLLEQVELLNILDYLINRSYADGKASSESDIDM